MQGFRTNFEKNITSNTDLVLNGKWNEMQWFLQKQFIPD